MRVEPDAVQAAGERSRLVGLVRHQLETGLADADGSTLRRRLERVLPLSQDGACYPGLMTEVHRLRSPHASGTENTPLRIDAVLERAERSARRAAHAPIQGWLVDLAPPEPHLVEATRRALAQAPARPDAEPALRVANWSEPQREVARAAGKLIKSVWPAMFDEMRVVVRQVALLAGPSVDGFTDFTTHGVVYVNDRRCVPSPAGLPARWHLAEALVHEATHNRCNGASLTTAFLRTDLEDSARIDTPLRSDPRPLAGLFQQVVVLARSVRLYDLALRRDCGVRETPQTRAALRARRDRLCEQGISGLATAARHAAGLSRSGASVIGEAEVILRDAAADRAPTTA